MKQAFYEINKTSIFGRADNGIHKYLLKLYSQEKFQDTEFQK